MISKTKISYLEQFGGGIRTATGGTLLQSLARTEGADTSITMIAQAQQGVVGEESSKHLPPRWPSPQVMLHRKLPSDPSMGLQVIS